MDEGEKRKREKEQMWNAGWISKEGDFVDLSAQTKKAKKFLENGDLCRAISGDWRWFLFFFFLLDVLNSSAAAVVCQCSKWR